MAGRAGRVGEKAREGLQKILTKSSFRYTRFQYTLRLVNYDTLR